LFSFVGGDGNNNFDPDDSLRKETFSWFVFVKNQIYKRLFWSNIWKKKSHHWLLFFSGS
jgi:hypothetical protein